MMDRPRLRAFVFGLLHGVLLVFAFPPFGLWWLSFVAPVPVFVLACRPGGSAFRAGFWAMLGVAPFWAWTHAWVWSISAAGVYPLVLYLSLYTWVFVWLGARAARHARIPGAIALSVAWVGLEFFRARIAWSGYPWYLTAHPLIDAPGLAAPAALGGVSLVSWLTVLPAAWWATRGDGRRTGGLVAAMALALWAVGVLVWRPDLGGATELRVGVVQADVPQDHRVDWLPAQRLVDWMRLRDLTIEAGGIKPAPELIVWPEGLSPGWTLDPDALAHERARGIMWLIRPQTPDQQRAAEIYGDTVPATRAVDEMLEIQHAIGVPMLVGSVAFDGLRIETGEDGGIDYNSDATYNSAFLLEGGRVADAWYDKLHLTPFGEVMPYISMWGWLQDRLLSLGAEGMAFALAPGRNAKTLTLRRAGDEIELATPICFEATIPGVCRTLANAAGATGRPVVLINITNDGWFGRSDRARVMHEMGARWRCVELGLPMVRCANTGVSGSIDAAGRVVERLSPRRAGTGVFVVRPGSVRTPFARFGEWAGWAALAGTGLLALVGRRFSREPGTMDERTE